MLQAILTNTQDEATKYYAGREHFLPSPSIVDNFFDSFTWAPFPSETTPVDEITALITATPDDANLYLRRALVCTVWFGMVLTISKCMLRKIS